MTRPTRAHPSPVRRAARFTARAATRLGATVVIGAALTLGLGACVHQVGNPTDDQGPAAAPSSTAAPTAARATRTTVRAVVGRLDPAQRLRVKTAVSQAVDHWVDAGYLGSYPRSDFGGAFATFTPGAAERAERDAALLTNAGIGSQLTSAVAVRRDLTLDVLAVHGRPVGVTAQLVLGLRLSGSVSRRDRVTAHLSLTHEDSPAGDAGSWRVFAYDVQRGQV